MRKSGLLSTLLLLVCSASAQTGTTATTNATPYLLPRNAISIGVGFLSTTGDPGYSAVNVFGGLRHRGFELAGEFDAGGTNIKVPDITVKVRQQDYLIGPRFYFSRAMANPRFVPFAHLLFGMSHQSTSVEMNGVEGPESSDNAYSWSVGGGVQYTVNRNWAVRGRGDVYRTHFLDDSQTHARYGLSLAYSFGRSQ